MTWYSIDTWIVIIGMLSALSCALLGNFLVLRQMSMMGDAISHAVLPGLAAAFLLTGDRASVSMFLGAALVGVLTAVFTQWVNQFGKVDRGASMGIVFTTLFAIGLIMIVQAADAVDLDPGCVLYGAIELTPLDVITSWQIGDTFIDLPRAAVTLGVVLVVNVLAVLLFYKELKISSFDPALATTLGINARLMHYLLMTLVAVTTVASFEAIGSIIVIAMLIVPAAAAHLLTDRLGLMIVVSLVIAALSSAGGHVAAITVPGWFGFVDTTTSGMMAAVAGGLFLLAMLGAPRHGVISKALHRAALSLRIVREDTLGLLYRLEEVGTPDVAMSLPTVMHQAVGASPTISHVALRSLMFSGLVHRKGQAYELTDTGRTQARTLVRTHRLWETYLQKHLHLPLDHLHNSAERMEHFRSEAVQRELDAAAGHASEDPHGRQVPPENYA